MQFYLGGPVPLYCEAVVEGRIRKSYDYAFSGVAATHPGAVPQLVFRRITTEPFEALGVRITPVRLKHGPRFDVLGFRIGDVAYCTDVSRIPDGSWPLLEGLQTLVLDALRTKPHPTHFSVDEALAVIERLRPGKAYLTHMSHELDHETTNRRLPVGVELAYDGLRFDF